MQREINRRALVKGMLAAGTLGGVAAGAVGAAGAGAAAVRQDVADQQVAELARGGLCVTQHGARGDGETPEAELLQGLLDRLAEQGGGVAVFPPGRYILEKTLLIPSNVHVVGHGRQTVFQGRRPDDISGYALIANAGIVTEKGYDGASDFSLQNVAIDSPRTNGIVLVHAQNAYFSHIYGLDAFHHHFDIAGSRNVICENLFLTGRSGTAPFQIDGSPFYNNTWDGRTNLQPIQDGTPNDGIFLSYSVIRPANRPNHGIHFHRDGGRNIFIDNVLIEHLHNGIFRDANCHRTDVLVSNVVIRDVSDRGIHFRQTRTPDQRVTFDNVTIQDVRGEGLVEYHGCAGLTVRNLRATAGEQAGSRRLALRDVAGANLDGIDIYGAGSGSAVWLRGCSNVFVSKLRARHVSRSLWLEACETVCYSGIVELKEDASPRNITIRGAEHLVPWAQS